MLTLEQKTTVLGYLVRLEKFLVASIDVSYEKNTFLVKGVALGLLLSVGIAAFVVLWDFNGRCGLEPLGHSTSCSLAEFLGRADGFLLHMKLLFGMFTVVIPVTPAVVAITVITLYLVRWVRNK